MYVKLPPKVPQSVIPLVRTALDPLLCITPKQACIIVSMMKGRTLKQIAEDSGRSDQSCFSAWKIATETFPAIRSLANGRIGSGRGRKPGK